MEKNDENRETLIANYELLLDRVHHDLKNDFFALGLTIELLKKAPEDVSPRLARLLDNLVNKLQQMKMLINELMQAKNS